MRLAILYNLREKSGTKITLEELGEVESARVQLSAVVEGKTVQLGADHASTLASKWNLALLLGEQLDNRAGAVALAREIMASATRNPNAVEPTADGEGLIQRVERFLARWAVYG